MIVKEFIHKLTLLVSSSLFLFFRIGPYIGHYSSLLAQQPLTPCFTSPFTSPPTSFLVHPGWGLSMFWSLLFCVHASMDMSPNHPMKNLTMMMSLRVLRLRNLVRVEILPILVRKKGKGKLSFLFSKISFHYFSFSDFNVWWCSWLLWCCFVCTLVCYAAINFDWTSPKLCDYTFWHRSTSLNGYKNDISGTTSKKTSSSRRLQGKKPPAIEVNQVTQQKQNITIVIHNVVIADNVVQLHFSIYCNSFIYKWFPIQKPPF